MAILYTTRFKVEGRGSFPVDMLRYDACFPVRPDDVSNITFDSGDRQSRTVLLEHRHGEKRPSRPTIGRWSSFGWVVLDHPDPETWRGHKE